MEFDEAYEKLLESSNFQEWHKNNERSYLAHFFAELDQHLRPLNWEVGYYNPEKDLITTFAVNEAISIQPEAQVFKEKNTIEKLDVKEVTLSADDALRKGREFQLKQYKQHPPLKGIIILQRLAIGAVWNITFITQSFAALNIKVDARNGEIIHHHLATFFDFKTK